MALDCQTCGACCCNLAVNRDAGLEEYVEVTARDSLFLVPELLERWAVRSEDGSWHLKVVGGDRCAALSGVLGRRVSCELYALRPAPCRSVEPGSAECLEARAERGLSVDWGSS